MINLPGCTEPASGLYEAREIPYEVHRICSAVYGLLQSMRKLKISAKGYSLRFQNCAKHCAGTHGIPSDYLVVLHVIFM